MKHIIIHFFKKLLIVILSLGTLSYLSTKLLVDGFHFVFWWFISLVILIIILGFNSIEHWKKKNYYEMIINIFFIILFSIPALNFQYLLILISKFQSLK